MAVFIDESISRSSKISLDRGFQDGTIVEGRKTHNWIEWPWVLDRDGGLVKDSYNFLN
jgi:hypothetical protein